MKRLVNGQEVDLQTGQATVQNLADRVMVKSSTGTNSALAVKTGDKTYISYRGQQFVIEPVKAARAFTGKDHSGDLISLMPGAVVEVFVVEGQPVSKGDRIVILEAMKTQQTFLAPFNGKITKVTVSKGEQVAEGLIMAVVEPAEE
jgi:3-methylcrotonyl-CoA carboxylase alpha subunit